MAQRRPDRVLGPGHNEFWDWCGKSELRLQRCGACNRLSWPPVETCEYCGHADLSWERMSGSAKLVSWCTFDRDYYAGVLPLPWDAILVELEEGPLLVSNPIGLTREEFKMDLPLKLRFLECEDNAGAFNLPAFEPA